MKSKTRIFAFHLLNDFSGSPKVLMQLIQCWTNHHFEVHVYTSQKKKGFLSGLPKVQYHQGWYQFASNPWLRLLYYTLSQVLLFCKMLLVVKKQDIVYVNTVLPFGAALLGKLKGCRVIYHIHESTVNPKILKWFLFKIVKQTASDIVNVSHFVEQSHGIQSVKNHLIYNAIENTFLEKAAHYQHTGIHTHVLMVCSLKAYKGVFEYVQLANALPHYSFRLVMNATRAEIDTFFSNTIVPDNLEIFTAQSNMHLFYQWATVVLNLSRPNEWVETFGLTILEAMAYGLPTIVPPVGGITELVLEGENGYKVDCRESNQLKNTLTSIFSQQELYALLASNARKRVHIFNESVFEQKSLFLLMN
jgi:L-malate glycosyltransferase